MVLYTSNFIYALRDIKVIAWTTLVFAIVLYIADKNKFDKKISTNLNIQTIFFIISLEKITIPINAQIESLIFF